MDFKMNIGTAIHCARTGVVIEAVDSFSDGGLKEEYLYRGNHLIVQREDSSLAGYWHLNPNSLKIQKGETVLMGQLHGESGNTGYSAFPHLHFMIFRYGPDNSKITIPARFNTSEGWIYLKPGNSFECVDDR